MTAWIKCFFGLVSCGLCAQTAFAQFETANVTVQAEARSFLETLGGTGILGESGGAGAYPLFLGMANADQTIGTSSEFASSQVGVELSPMGLSATGSMHANMVITDETISGNCSALARAIIEFTLTEQMIWTIPTASVLTTKAEGSITLLRGETTLFQYFGSATNESGVLEPGTYKLSLEVNGYSDFNIAGDAADASFSLEFQLASIHYCTADFNNDNVVDDADFSIFVNSYDLLDCADPAMPSGCPADLNGDLAVDDADFSIFVVAYDALLCPE